MRTTFFSVLFLAVHLFGNAADIGVWNPKVMLKKDPVGVVAGDVTFSWEIQSQKRGEKQTAYRIGVSSSLENLNKGKFDLWDSRKVLSDESINIRYEGRTLPQGETFYWKVRSWDSKRKASEWSQSAKFATALSSADQWMGAQWIGFEEMPTKDYLVPGIHNMFSKQYEGKLSNRAVVPLFRKEFSATKKVKSALMFITGLGHYEASLNGKRVSESFIAPGWTQYNKRVLFNTYDVTSSVKDGSNAIGVIVGNGFHYINRERYLKLGIAYGYPKMICRLKISYEDGSVENIISNETWKVSASPTLYSSIYGGEDYDARLEQSGWNLPSFNEKEWKKAVLVSAPKGDLCPETDNPVALFESFPYKIVHEIDGGSWTYDFGQNASGIIEIKVRGKKGDVIKFHPGELVTPDKRVNQRASGSPYYFTYTCKGDGVETWRPKFTYYGFRYVTVEGARPINANQTDNRPVIEELYLVHNRNSAEQVGAFNCSNDLFNRIFTLIDWAVRSNFQSVMTDCPHREKLGWLEQTYLMGNSVRYNYSLSHLYKKQIQDMIDAQLDNGLVPDITPEYVIFEGGFRDSPEWGSAAVIIPWMIYKWYGDKTVLNTAYDMMCRYVAYLKSTSDRHIVSHGLGDWFDYGPKSPGEAQLTPKAVTATGLYYYDVKLLSQIAKTLGKEDDSNKYGAWANEIKVRFNEQFFDKAKATYATGSQTALSLPLCVGLVEDQYREQVVNSLRKCVVDGGYALTAGDVGFHYLVEALSNNGSSDLLFKMINRDDVPGYGFQLAKGATALTESWPALEQVSNNHLMLGHIMEWFYTSLLGIKDAEASVAGSDVCIAPTPVGDITWAKGSYKSVKGIVSSDWKIENGRFVLSVVVPSNVKARIVLPSSYKSATESDKPLTQRPDMKVLSSTEDQGIAVEVGGGSYRFVAAK